MVACSMHGIIPAVFTPFHDDGQINLEPIPQYANFLAKNGIKNILVGGTTGEFVTLTVEEKKTVLDAWLKEAKSHNFKVMVHVGGAPLPYVIEMANYAEKVKVDAILTLPELYFKPKSAEQLVSYLELVANAAPSTSLVYYNNPVMSGVDNINFPVFYKLAVSRIPTFIGIKADLTVANQLSNYLSCDRKVYITNHILAPAVLMGHDSSIVTAAAAFPKLVVETVESAKAGKIEQARLLQAKLNDIIDVIYTEGNVSSGMFVPAFKAAMEFVTGIKVGPPRLPQYPLEGQRVSRMQERLKELGYPAANQ